jgi:hypothetical protein
MSVPSQGDIDQKDVCERLASVPPTMFERFDFRPAYEIEVDPEFPPEGDWHAPAFFFDGESTVSQSPGDSRWGAPLVIRVMRDQDRWVGTFTAGIDGVRGVFATPDPHRVCCVVAGLAYVVNVNHPGSGAELAHWQTESVTPVTGRNTLLLVGFVDITALSNGGIEWRSEQLVLDDLTVLHASADGIVCTGTIPGDDAPRITLDPSTGRVIAGPQINLR